MSVIVVDIRAKDNISPSMNRAKRSIEGFEKAVDKMQKKVEKMNRAQVKMMMDAYDRVLTSISKVRNEISLLTRRDWKIAMSIQLKGGLSGIKTALADFSKGLAVPLKVVLHKQSFRTTYENLNRGNKVIQKPAGITTVPGNNPYVNTQTSMINGASGEYLSKQKARKNEKTGNSDGWFTNITSYVGENILKPVGNDYAKTLVKKGIGKVIGNAGNGTGLLGFGANTAIKLGAGNLAGGASLSPAALSTVGLGAAAGAVVGGASVISGGMDLYKGLKSQNKEEAAAYKASGISKIGGVAAGAAIGASVGSVVPVLGTAAGALIGAGIGGFAGWMKGDSIKEEYFEKAKKDAEALALAEEQAKYKSQELKDALADSNMTAEEFGQKFQKVVGENFKNHFGNAQYSLEQMRKLMNKITFGNSIKSINKFSQASLQAKSDFDNFNQSVSNMERQNWKIGLGLKLSNSDKMEFQSSVDDFIQSSKKYIESKRYEATAAVNVLFKGKKAKNLIASTDKTYKFYQERIDLNSKRLEDAKRKALNYDKVPRGLKKEMKGYQKNIRKDINTVSNAENYASRRAMKIKYGDAALSSGSFQELQGSSKEYVDNAEQIYFEALNSTIASAKLKHEKNPRKFTKDHLNLAIDNAEKAYNDKVLKVNTNMTDFQLDTIAKNFYPMMESNTSMDEKGISNYFKQVLYNAMKTGEDPKNWDRSTIEENFGLNDFITDEDDRATVYERLFETIKSLPDHFKNMLQDKDYIQQQKEMVDFIENLPKLLKLNDSESKSSYFDIPPWKGEGFPGAGSTSHKFTMNGVQQNTEIPPKMPEDGATENPPQLPGAGLTFQESFKIPNTASPSQVNINQDSTTEAIDSVKNNMQTDFNSKFEQGFDISTTVRVTANYILQNPFIFDPANGTFSINNIKSNKGDNTEPTNNEPKEGKPVKKALGGFPIGKQLSWICEEGPEAIIPLTSQRRQRALDLYEKTGRILGVNKVGKNARGGLIGIQSIPDKDNNEMEEIIPTRKGTAMEDETASKPTIEINVDLGNNEFNISGSENSEGVMSYIREHIAEIANEAGGEIAASLEEIFSNTPVTEGA